MKRALILGVMGQDGSYLAKHLLDLGYEVFGVHRNEDNFSANHNYLGISSRIKYLKGTVTSAEWLRTAIAHTNPTEVYNLAAQSSVAASWNNPSLAGSVTAQGAHNVFDAVRRNNPRGIRIFQASSAEIFGNAGHFPCTEDTPLNPTSPYGVAKAYAHQMVIAYRERYGMFVSNGILFNHESPLRDARFVTRKITKSVANIKYRRQHEIELGNINTQRDWGHAADYVRAMHLMLQTDKPDDFVIASGKTRSIMQFLQAAFGYVGLDFWGFVVPQSTQDRPKDIDMLWGDATKAKEILGWEPLIPFTQMVHEMVDFDLKEIANG